MQTISRFCLINTCPITVDKSDITRFFEECARSTQTNTTPGSPNRSFADEKNNYTNTNSHKNTSPYSARSTEDTSYNMNRSPSSQPQSYGKTTLDCCRCMKELPSKQVYINMACHHQYCCYCIGSYYIQKNNQTFCLSHDCTAKIDRGSVEAFYSDFISSIETPKGVDTKTKNFSDWRTKSDEKYQGDQQPKIPSPESSNSAEKAKIRIPAQMIHSESKICNLCGNDVIDQFIFTNPGCRHNYCCYCIRENYMKHAPAFCFVKGCQTPMREHEIIRFNQECSDVLKTPKQRSPENGKSFNFELSDSERQMHNSGSRGHQLSEMLDSKTLSNVVMDNNASNTGSRIYVSPQQKQNIRDPPDGKSLINNENAQNVPSNPDKGQNQLKECVICKQEILSNLTFTNQFCSHNYCYYCIKDCLDEIYNFCLVRRCPQRLDKSKVMSFLKDCSQSLDRGQVSNPGNIPDEGRAQRDPANGLNPRIASQNKMDHVDDSNDRAVNGNHYESKGLKCFNCRKDSTRDNLIFQNDGCGHSFCFSCFNSGSPPFDGECFEKKCTEGISYYKFKDFFHNNTKDPSFDVRCNRCLSIEQSNKVFVNPECQHIFCADCAGAISSFTVSSTTLPGRIWMTKHCYSFKENLIREQYNKPMTKEITKMLPHATTRQRLLSQAGSKLDYWKCPGCNQLCCPHHDELMTKCLCLCPKCLAPLKRQ